MCLKALAGIVSRWLPLLAHAERIRDRPVSGGTGKLADRLRARWSGLDGTGDQRATERHYHGPLNNMLAQLGICGPHTGTNMRLKNIGGGDVVTASYPPLRDRDKRSMSSFPQ